MNKKKVLILLIVVAVGIVVYDFINTKEQTVLYFGEINIDENGCGNLTQSDIINKLNDQGRTVSNLSGIEEHEILGCTSYTFTIDTGENVVVTDKGEVEINNE